MTAAQGKGFQKNKEDFICEKCGFAVHGNGYTDHCPKCLSGKHVDVNPGDRAADCGGFMEPVSVESKGREYIILYRCLKCGLTHRNRAAKDDNFDAILRISNQSG